MTQQEISRLLTIMQQLRDPDKGCEWDKAQNYQSIIPYTLEETYEVIDAIERQDFDELKNELGDLLFQIVFYSSLAEEEQHFTFADVCCAISDKLIRRHPHIFKTHSQMTEKQWEQQKRVERVARNQHSVLDDIPQSLPALMRAEKLQKRCASSGFDWNDIAPVIDKVLEELEEVKQALSQEIYIEEQVEEELGDLLFAVVNICRHLGVNSEQALRRANAKFECRFRKLEHYFQQSNQSLNNTSLIEMESIWQKIKQQEKIG